MSDPRRPFQRIIQETERWMRRIWTGLGNVWQPRSGYGESDIIRHRLTVWPMETSPRILGFRRRKRDSLQQAALSTTGRASQISRIRIAI